MRRTLDGALPAGVQRPLVLDGVATKAMEAMTSGIVLAGLALHLGASDAAIGVLAALPLVAQLAQFPALRLLFWMRDRKRLCLAASFTSRLLVVAVGGVALLGPGPGRLEALFALWLLSAAFGAAGGVSWNYWMRDLIPRGALGAVFASRMRWQALVSIGLIVVSGWVVTSLTAGGREAEGFAILFLTGSALGFLGLLFVRQVPNVPLDPVDRAPSLRTLLVDVWTNRDSRRALRLVAAIGFCTTFAFPFLTVFMLRTLGLPFTVVALLSASSLLASVVCYPLWGSLTDRFGNKPVLAITLPLFIVTMVALTFVEAPTAGALAVLVAVHVGNGAALAALDLASANLVLKKAPAKDGAAFLAAASIVRSLSAAVAAALAGLLATFFASRSLRIVGVWSSPDGTTARVPLTLAHYDFLFLVTAVLVVYTLHRLALVSEPGEHPRRIVLRELQLAVQAGSSVIGGRAFGALGGHLTRYVHDRRARER